MTEMDVAAIAGELGTSVLQVRRTLESLGITESGSGGLDADAAAQVKAVLSTELAGSPSLRRLIMTAFESARSKGHPQWHTMTAAVLKNRLLQATGHNFDEFSYGYRSFIELCRSLPDLLTIDDARRPPTVTLQAELEAVSTAALDTLGDRVRIRGDLWNAIMDYSHGHPWIWVAGEAVSATQVQHWESADELPTINADILAQWRRNFISNLQRESLDSLAPDSPLRLWLATGASTFRLPPGIKRPWNATLKQNVLHRLTEWFRSRDEQPPADILTGERAIPEVDRKLPPSAVRLFAEACIAVMTDTEISGLPIPAEVAVRALQRRPELGVHLHERAN